MPQSAPRKIERLLIANRGEIAVRIIRACREVGISPVVVYSEADANAPHVALADFAVNIGPGAATESYLRIDKIIDAAQRTSSNAIHPGYGFLAENADFARAVINAGLIWVGPPPSAIDLLGDKIAAKKRVSAAGVPVVPGYYGDDQSPDLLAAEAAEIGVPLLIKAAAGGGGRGQRVVRDLAQLHSALEEAKRESKASFGDDRVLLERFLTRPRHVEFQIFGDESGNVVSLFERECSVQRRQQKIIEESPSPVMTETLRKRMGDAAVAAAVAAGYVGAGTVEFLVDASGPGEPDFFFLEVNTRLQVEHSVTELVTGLDLVRLQLLVAEGAPLAASTGGLSLRGHAMEFRIYAEDPATGFLPSIGPILQWIVPEGPGIRVDSGVARGSQVSPFYDPMLAKLIVYAAHRSEVIDRAKTALREFHVLGVRTNIEYMLAILEHPEFAAGNLTIRFLDEHFSKWRSSDRIPEEILLAIAAENIVGGHGTGQSYSRSKNGHRDAQSYNSWASSGAWRNAR